MTTIVTLHWKPVEIELPAPNVEVMIDGPDGVSIGAYHADGSWLDLCKNDSKPVVLHWANKPAGARP